MASITISVARIAEAIASSLFFLICGCASWKRFTKLTANCFLVILLVRCGPAYMTGPVYKYTNFLLS